MMRSIRASGFWVGYPVPRHDQQAQELLKSSLSRLSRLGVGADGEWVRGDPGPEIARCALRFGADLIVLGHRRETLLERWWSGASGGYLVDQVGCSVLLARDLITGEDFETHLASSLERHGPI